MRKRALALAFLSLALVAQDPPKPAPRLIIYHPGSITAGIKAVEALYTRKTGVEIMDVAGGSVSLVRRVTAGNEPCDLLASADDQLLDQMVKPAGYADFTLRIAEGSMVLAYTTASRNAGTIAAPGPFNPPGAVPEAAPDWYKQLLQPGVKINGGHPFLDPGAYRADLILQLAQDHYGVPNLYDRLLSHYVITGVQGGLGTAYDYQFSYEHGARAAAKADKTGTYRYVKLPAEVGLGVSSLNGVYARHGISMPGLQAPGAPATVFIPATRVTWGVTMLKSAPNRERALAFLELLCSPEGAEAMNGAGGPAALTPPVVRPHDFEALPSSLKPLVRAQ